MFGDGLWSLVIIVGPIVLIVALAYAMIRNRRTPQEEAKTEAATRALYKEQSAEDRPRTP